MKVRMQGNSLRLRLNQSEVAQFSKTGFVEDRTEFAPGISLAYSLETSSSLSAPQASFQDHWLRVELPVAVAKEWYTTDQVGISGDQTVENGKALSILIEKDFQCVHSAPDPEAFPNPLEQPVR